MEKLIACCGINCATCDAMTATVKNDDELRKATAEKWGKMYNTAELTWKMINCTGCREAGIKFSHCTQCEIRNCVKSKDFETCADCAEMETCPKVSGIHKALPEAKDNLKNLN